MKQTAIDYLFQELWDRPKDRLNWNYFLQKAKDMEREQILNAYGDGYFADRIKSVVANNRKLQESGFEITPLSPNKISRIIL